MRIAEYLIDAAFCIKQFVNLLTLSLISKGDLILQVVETVVHRCGRKHKHFCLHPFTNNLIHQLQVTVFTGILIVLVGRYLTTITEVVAFVDNHKVIIAPVDVVKVKSIGYTAIASEVGMKKHIITKSVSGNRIVYVVTAIGYPVVIEFLGA